MKDFGSRLRKLRRDAEMSQAELAEQLGVVPSAVGKYERLADSYPSVEILLKIADYFNVSTDYLLRGIQPMAIVENNISGELTNSPLIQANHGNVLVNDRSLSPEAIELLHIYESLSGRERLKLLNFAVDMEEKSKEGAST
ncbi:MAG: helix-turn-helix domain-containing protein [Selenomonas sp.]|nr:helix-turn-helix domain-containing protein [Selenomonas sp.]MBP3730988.1 helix-turn-helix domain-containing protein [Mailhella sp.]